MKPDDALSLLARIDAAQITAWVDGGWGVDALIGHQRRQHSDLDLAVDARDVDRLRELLTESGFTVIRDWLPAAIAFKHPDGREVDLHPLEMAGDGGGYQILPDGVRWRYEPPVPGRIGGQRVACTSIDTQIAAHVGYEPDENDHADMAALAAAFDCELPEPYRTPPAVT